MNKALRIFLTWAAFPVFVAVAVLICLVIVLQVSEKQAGEQREMVVDRVETLEAKLAAAARPEYVRVRVDGVDRYYVRPPDESEVEWAQRVAKIVRGEVEEGIYLCTTLTGCMPPVERVEVCTPCNSNPPSAQCRASHAASVAAFCVEFQCTDCGGR